jgi:hypothetical protein
VLHGLKLQGWWNDRGERRGGVKDGFLLLWPHGLKSGVTGQTGDGHRSDRWPPKVEPESPYQFFRTTLGRTDDLDKIQQRGLIGRTDTPSVVVILSSFLRFCSLKLLQKCYRTFCIHLGRRKRIM